MRENDEILGGLDIRETIDGRPVAARNGSRPSRTAGATAASAATAASDSKAAVKKPDPKASKKFNRPDPYIWGIYIMLLVISVVELFSASSTEIKGENVYGPLIRHVIFLVMGLGIVLWLQRTPYTIISKFAWAFAILSLGLLLLSSFIGEEINGAQRAINIGGFTIQPAEIVKLSVVCLLASILGKNQTPGGVTTKGVIVAGIVVVVFGACLWRNGLTNTILLMLVSICMMLIGGIQWRKFFTVMGIYAIGVAALVSIKYVTPSTTEFDRVEKEQQLIRQSGAGGALVVGESDEGVNRTGTHKGRITRFIEGVNPDDPIDDYNRQVIFSKFPPPTGGLLARGRAISRERARLPLAFSDYIYSIIVEDTGFVGGALILLLYMLLVARAGRIAYKCSRAFPAFLILGCAVMIVLQAFVHMAIVTGLFPVSGQPLPLISKGGTSVLVMSAALGIMLSVSRFAAHSKNKNDVKEEMKTLPDDMQAANYSGTTA